MKDNHWNECDAPICSEDPTEGWEQNVTWFPGERICKHKPRLPYQKVQEQINQMVKEGTYKHTGYFTAETLQAVRWVTPDFKGKDPNKE